MRINFKHRFVVAFVLLEVIFISLILTFNFLSVNQLSQRLINEEIDIGSAFLAKWVRASLTSSELGTLDGGLKNFIQIQNIVAIKISTQEGKILAETIEDGVPSTFFEELPGNFEYEHHLYRFVQQPIVLDDKLFGQASLIFDMTDKMTIVNQHQKETLWLIVFEVFISIWVAYWIGHRLTRGLGQLTQAARNIADQDSFIMPKIGKPGDEIYVLSEALYAMQAQLIKRNQNLLELNAHLQSLASELHKQKDFQSALLNAAHSVILVMDAQGDIVQANPTVEKITGYASEEIIGKKPWDVFLPEALRDDVQRVFSSLAAGDFPNTYENIWLTKSGDPITFAWFNSCTLSEQGQVEFVIAIGIDITERQKSERTIRALLNAPPDAMMLIDIEGRVLEANEVAAKRLNKPLKELIGSFLATCFSEDLVQQRRVYLKQALTTKAAVDFEDRRDGMILENHLYPILNEANQVTQLAILSRDVTALRRTQKEFDLYVDMVDQHVITSSTDIYGTITQVSTAFCNVSGYEKAELLGKSHNIVRHEDMPATLYKDLWTTIQAGQVWQGEVKNKKKNGDFYWVDITIQPNFDEAGTIEGYSAIRHLITDKKLVEELSITDPLTSLYNRRHLDAVFMEELNRVRRDKHLFFFLLCDIDHFKLYNDNYGHPMGDKVLQTISRILKSNMKRSGDFAFRLGGEEFAVIFMATHEAEGIHFAERMREAIEAEQIPHKANLNSAFVTASFGGVFVDFAKSHAVEPCHESLYRQADSLLYQIKGTGRNQVLITEYL